MHIAYWYKHPRGGAKTPYERQREWPLMRIVKCAVNPIIIHIRASLAFNHYVSCPLGMLLGVLELFINN
jgi:hypothetical protein